MAKDGTKGTREDKLTLLQAFVDSFPHVAWIEDDNSKRVLLNEHASLFVKQGANLEVLRAQALINEGGVVSHNERLYRIAHKPMNHGTGLTLYELILADIHAVELRASTVRLKQALHQIQ